MHNYSDSCRREAKKIGLVPTMGYLHEGHLSLVREAKKLSDIVVVSLFVNPTQFAPNEDLAKYPRDVERDKMLLEKEAVDVLFMPDAGEVYPADYQTYIEVQSIAKKLEGSSRPAHFKGVTTVVGILFNAVRPYCAIFGQKDAQQAAVIRQMNKDLKYGINIIVAPIIREEDGLAMSSRNVYLNEQERKDALVLSKALKTSEYLLTHGETDTKQLIKNIESIITSAGTSKLDYIAIVNEDNFESADHLESGFSYYILIACWIGTTRLIDNIYIKK